MCHHDDHNLTTILSTEETNKFSMVWGKKIGIGIRKLPFVHGPHCRLVEKVILTKRYQRFQFSTGFPATHIQGQK